jgi:shikimate kinase
VVSLGGGTPCFFNNMSFLKKTGKTVYLQTPVGILVSRLMQSKTERPLLAGKNEDAVKDFMEKQLQQREKFYLKADHIVQNDGKLKAVDLVAVLN